MTVPLSSVFPRPAAADSDDVVWTLQTAAVQWQRGLRADAIVWVRKAADTAIEQGNDRRADELRDYAARLAEYLWSDPDEVLNANALGQAASSVPAELLDEDFLDDDEIEIEEVEPADSPSADGAPARRIGVASQRAAFERAPTMDSALDDEEEETTPVDSDDEVTAVPADDGLGSRRVLPDYLELDQSETDVHVPGDSVISFAPGPADLSPSEVPLGSEPMPRLEAHTIEEQLDFDTMVPPRRSRSAPPSLLPHEPAGAIAEAVAGGLRRRDSLRLPTLPSPPLGMPAFGSVAPETEANPGSSSLPVSVALDSEPAQTIQFGSERASNVELELEPSESEDTVSDLVASEVIAAEAHARAERAAADDLGSAAPVPSELADSEVTITEMVAPEDAPSAAVTSLPPPAPSSGPASFEQLPSAPLPSTPPDPSSLSTRVDGVNLEDVDGLGDLPEDAQVLLAALARQQLLGRGDSLPLGADGVLLVTNGAVSVRPTLADVGAARVSAGGIVAARGSLGDALPLRVIAEHDDTRVALWQGDQIADVLSVYPWVVDELRMIADRLQARGGAALGSLGQRLDDNLREAVYERMDVRVFSPGELVVAKGQAAPGLIVVAWGEMVESEDGHESKHGAGQFVFASNVMGATVSPGDVRAGARGALALYAPRAVAHDLMMSVPPLLEILAS
ncbi:MAG: cyclic nucleotide-binding domain-containing protein [Polyangiaceae bacterium]